MAEMIGQAYAADGRSDGQDAETTRENLIHALERGEVAVAEFERALAARLRTLDGAPPVADGLLARMFAGFRPVEPMYDMLRAVRAAGLRTCLVSNSWGNDYPRDGWDELFDAVVISGEVGMRKPEPRIFQHALGTDRPARRRSACSSTTSRRTSWRPAGSASPASTTSTPARPSPSWRGSSALAETGHVSALRSQLCR